MTKLISFLGLRLKKRTLRAMEKPKLFDEFEPISREEWKAQVIADLKGKDYEQLIWHTEGMEIQPFYAKEDLLEAPTGNLDSFLYPNTTPDVLNEGRIWQNLENIVVDSAKQANQKALEALNHGADGIIFEISKDIPEFDLLLKDITLQSCAVYFSGNHSLIRPFEAYIEKQQLYKQQLNGGLLCAPSEIQSDWDLNAYAAFKKLFVNSDLPSTEEDNIQQLVATLQKTVAILDTFTDQGIAPGTILNNLIISFKIGSSYFKAIAKLRACRILIATIAAAYQAKNYNVANLHIHCHTSGKVPTEADLYDNIMRNTTASMAAILGGCNSLYVHPHSEGVGPNNSFSTRIARNVSLILKEESYFDKVSDPAAGSYYIENLTNLMAEKAWGQFLALV